LLATSQGPLMSFDRKLSRITTIKRMEAVT
jgi:hypothetical protein